MKRFYAFFTALAVVFAFNANAQTGETCASSIALSLPALAVSGSTAGMNDDYNEDCEGYGVVADGADLVYNFTVGTTGFWDFTLCQAGTAYDTKFYIFAGSCPTTSMSGTSIACDDDNCDGSAPQPWSSFMFNVLLSTGTTYYLVIDGYDAASEGAYVLSAAPASSPPTGDDMVLGNALSYTYTQIPEFNLTASNFAAVVVNDGANAANGVVVTMTAYGPNDTTLTVVDYTSSTAPISVAIGATEVVVDASGWTPSALGVYTMVYEVTSTTADDDLTNNTIVQALNVSTDVQARDYSAFGELLSATKLLYDGPTSEYAIYVGVNTDADLNGMTVLLSADDGGGFAGDPVVGNVYSVGADINDLTLVSTGTSPDVADTAQLVYDIPMTGSLPTGAYIAAYNGRQFVVQTDQIYSQGFSDLIRDDITTGGNWGFFAGPYAWSIDMVMSEAGAACNSAIPPANMNSNVTGSALQLTWDAVPNSVGCQINAGPEPGPFAITKNILGFEVSGANVPLSIIPPNNYKARVRCACNISPIDVTGYSNITLFTVPAPRVGAEIATTVFPNPAVDQLFVNFNGEAANAQVRVVSILGEVVSTTSIETVEGLNTLTLDVSNLTDGVYFVEIGEEVIEFTVAR